MAAALNRSTAKVTTPDGVHDRVSVIVRAGRARMTTRRTRQVLAERSDVTAVLRGNRNLAVVEFADGTSWLVDKSDCGCG